MRERVWKIGEVAAVAKVSVRTLRHYDEIGLLRPSRRSEAGYRLYTSGDLVRLQQILFIRELGLGLAQIRRVMLDPAFDTGRALRRQRDLLEEKARHTGALVDAVDRALRAFEKGEPMDTEEMFEVLGEFDPSAYEAEAEERWGDTEAYAESARRTKRYTKDDWKRIQAESAEITAALVAALERGLPPDDPAVQTIVERHWKHLERWFYTPTPEMYAGLGDLYVNDPRFTANIDKAHEGLAAYQRAAMQAYAESRR